MLSDVLLFSYLARCWWINNYGVFSIRSKNRHKGSSHSMNNHSWGFDITGGLVAAFSSTYTLCYIETDRSVARSIHRWGFDITGGLVAAFSSTYTLCNIETDRSVARSIITPATPSYSAAFSRWGSRFHYAYCIIYPRANNYVVCFVKWTSANYEANIVSTIYSPTLTHNVTLTSYAQWTILFLC